MIVNTNVIQLFFYNLASCIVYDFLDKGESLDSGFSVENTYHLDIKAF